MPQDTVRRAPTTSLDENGGGGAQEKAAEVVDRAQTTARQATGQAQEKLREQLDERSSEAGARITEQASDMRSVSETLREQGKHGPADAADRMAGYAERVGGYLREKDSGQLLADVEDFGRRQPWALAAAGLTLGFAASRFLKASSARRYHSRSASSHPVHANPPAPGLGSGIGAETSSTAPAPPTPQPRVPRV